MNNKTAPGEDGITAEIHKLTFNIFPKTITALQNGCLRNGVFPKRWKTAKIIPIMKPDAQNSKEVTKYRPIGLLNMGGTILEKAMINRINHHIYSTEFLNRNQYGFNPQTNTIDAIMAVNELFRKDLEKGKLQ
jgi:hypothetical protein